jgi:hypothetical protein
LKKDYILLRYEKSKTKNKKYDAIIQNKKNKEIKKIPFGDKRYNNYHDKTGLNLYPSLITGDKKRRRLYKLRHKKDVKEGYYSPGYFSFNILW